MIGNPTCAKIEAGSDISITSTDMERNAKDECHEGGAMRKGPVVLTLAFVMRQVQYCIVGANIATSAL